MTTAVMINPESKSVEPGILYSLDDIMARSGMGKTALRMARRSGLNVKYVGSRGYVLGRDFIDWVLENAKETR
jgi:hypothetical protein